MTPEVLWTEIHERFDPWAPPARPKWRIDRTDKGLYKVHVRLNRPFEKRCKVLVAGTKGAGKTAELLKLAEDRAERDQTFFFDLYQHLQNVIQDPSAINELQPWEVCALIGLAVHRGMASRFPTLWPAEPVERLSEAWTRLIPATSNTPVLSIGKLAETLAVLVSTAVDGGASIALATAGKLAGGVRWDRKLGRHERTSDQDPRVEALVESVHHVLEKAAEVSGKRLLFVLDGLDQIRNSQPATRLFIDSALLSNLPTVLVATAPYSMRFDQSLHGARGFEKHYVMNEPVLDKKAPDDPKQPGPGLRFFEELVEARTQGLVDIMDAAELRRLAWSSGGNPRDFMKLVRDAGGLAFDHGRLRIGPEEVEEAIDGLRRTLAVGLWLQDIEILRAVRAHPEVPPKGDERTEDLLANGRLLPYPNGPDWFYPHPTLLPRLDP